MKRKPPLAFADTVDYAVVSLALPAADVPAPVAARVVPAMIPDVDEPVTYE